MSHQTTKLSLPDREASLTATVLATLNFGFGNFFGNCWEFAAES
jgi:hypothetical protein